MPNPIEFARRLANGRTQRCGNRVSIEEAADLLTELQLKADLTETQPVSVATAPALVASEAHIGSVTGLTASKLVTPTLTVAGLYASGDYVGTSATPMDFTPLARVAGGSGLILGAVLVDDSAQTVACELWLFHTAPAGLPADNAAFTITDADALNLIAVIPFDTFYASALNTVSIGSIVNGQAPFTCDAADQSIFGVLVTRGAPTYATGQLHVTLFVSQD